MNTNRLKMLGLGLPLFAIAAAVMVFAHNPLTYTTEAATDGASMSLSINGETGKVSVPNNSVATVSVNADAIPTGTGYVGVQAWVDFGSTGLAGKKNPVATWPDCDSATFISGQLGNAENASCLTGLISPPDSFSKGEVFTFDFTCDKDGSHTIKLLALGDPVAGTSGAGFDTSGGQVAADSVDIAGSLVAATIDVNCGSTPDPKKQVVVALFNGFKWSSSSGSSSGDTGMETLKNALNSKDNIVAKVFEHNQQKAAAAYVTGPGMAGRKVVLIGHSYGADATIETAWRLNRMGKQVDKLIQIDSIDSEGFLGVFGKSDDIKPANVKVGLNYWQNNSGLSGQNPVKGSTNIDARAHLHDPPNHDKTNISHTNIDDNAALHAEIQNFLLKKTVPTGVGVAIPSPASARLVTVLDPIFIEALPGLSSKWDSGIVPLKSALSVSGDDGFILDVEFTDTVLQMADTGPPSDEKVTIELFGSVVQEDQPLGDRIEVEFQFDDLPGRLLSGQAYGEMVVSSGSGMGTFQQDVDLADGSFPFGGFTLEIIGDGSGTTLIESIRVVLNADIITTPKVGGIAVGPGVSGLPLETADSSGSSVGLLAGVVSAVAAAAFALGSAAWYGRRRWLR